MNKLTKGFTYAYNRNIGWQDRTFRTVIGLGAAIGAIFLHETNLTLTLVLGILAVAQLITVTSARCIICYFTGLCTISAREKRSLESKGISHE